ncbi:MAG TPA: prepilin-type N-terminal cleavage/methylation domain-containing protein [Verrucomicrobiota bacterium]|nr:prepilin-type N-terminal cleavage/methylation domain-containing protein [Verrucomicrobiota bacterium]
MHITKVKIFNGYNRNNGYTLIEIIGVLAIAAILLAMVPHLFRSITDEHINNESALMASFEKAFKDNVMRNRSIPDQNGWASVIANELGIPIYQVTNIYNQGRIFLIDPQFKIGSNLTSLPYIQGTNGSLKPINPRVMIISSLGPPLPEQSGVSANFNAIWNTPDGLVPAVWQNSWKSKGEFLRIQRIGLESLFKFVIINNLDPNGNAIISVDNSPPFPITRDPAGFSGFFFRDTVFSFYDTNGVKIAQNVLQNDYSFVFESGVWRGKLLDGREKTTSLYRISVAMFLAAPTNPNAKFGAKPINILDFFCEYARAYTLWSIDGFPYTKSEQQYPAMQQLKDYQALLSQTSSDLIN